MPGPTPATWSPRFSPRPAPSVPLSPHHSPSPGLLHADPPFPTVSLCKSAILSAVLPAFAAPAGFHRRILRPRPSPGTSPAHDPSQHLQHSEPELPRLHDPSSDPLQEPNSDGLHGSSTSNHTAGRTAQTPPPPKAQDE
ncbi:uncharacterized protein PHACADRAFT_200327 [Phanerochaete carnosa HHB-10118-sp]|uniref:Uncharacterized protein n=1 Tax=Phanerochaete carnosa (strain HHB-10118-sp) TaxID=650164 RepID=K5VGQ5_PHACS|nr:uncharacterized protein PHACADRAFT_200327 [Phanerochaete carnosa HHB-10118-sp]EKM50378.1 hypothetical protein PHACADRAFT_200327 [Phanerochaete carnosa HHB-10118-sp]